jgi:hypothetical protein
MRVTIHAIDNIVYINNEVRNSDCAELLAEGVRAIQWDNKNGILEYVGHKKPNEVITDFAPYQKYIDQSTTFPELELETREPIFIEIIPET